MSLVSSCSPYAFLTSAYLVTCATTLTTGCGASPEKSPGTASTDSPTWPGTGSSLATSTATLGSGPEAQESASGSSSTAPTEIDLSIQFEAKVGHAPFVCGQEYPGVGTAQSSIAPVDFRFYVHNLRLLDLQGRDVPVTVVDRSAWQAQGVALLDFENDVGNCRFGGDSGLNDLVTARAPQGEYRGLRFTLGVPPKLNHQDPLSLGAPFQSGGMLWNWLSGFKFLALEFRSGEVTGLLHVGSTACTGGGPKAVECSKSNRAEVFFPNFVPGVSRIAADLGAVFANSDLRVDQICHSDQHDSCAPLFTQAGITWASGAPLDAQSFFSLAGPSAH